MGLQTFVVTNLIQVQMCLTSIGVCVDETDKVLLNVTAQICDLM